MSIFSDSSALTILDNSSALVILDLAFALQTLVSVLILTILVSVMTLSSRPKAKGSSSSSTSCLTATSSLTLFGINTALVWMGDDAIGGAAKKSGSSKPKSESFGRYPPRNRDGIVVFCSCPLGKI
eukprot:09108.XXX_145819_146196_1 [CDS] Oithona nana genome sequencing.